MNTQTIVLAVLASGGLWSVVNVLVAAWIDKRRIKREMAMLDASVLEAHGKALRGLLYGELERKCSYYLRKGSITAAELNDLRRYYFEPYTEGLEGDGTIQTLFKKVEGIVSG